VDDEKYTDQRDRQERREEREEQRHIDMGTELHAIRTTLVKMEVEFHTWRESVERRLGESSDNTKWIVGLIGSALVVLVTTLLLRGGGL